MAKLFREPICLEELNLLLELKKVIMIWLGIIALTVLSWSRQLANLRLLLLVDSLKILNGIVELLEGSADVVHTKDVLANEGVDLGERQLKHLCEVFFPAVLHGFIHLIDAQLAGVLGERAKVLRLRFIDDTFFGQVVLQFTGEQTIFVALIFTLFRIFGFLSPELFRDVGFGTIQIGSINKAHKLGFHFLDLHKLILSSFLSILSLLLELSDRVKLLLLPLSAVGLNLFVLLTEDESFGSIDLGFLFRGQQIVLGRILHNLLLAPLLPVEIGKADVLGDLLLLVSLIVSDLLELFSLLFDVFLELSDLRLLRLVAAGELSLFLFLSHLTIGVRIACGIRFYHLQKVVS